MTVDAPRILDPGHLLLLEAILSPDERSRTALERWGRGRVVTQVDHQAAPVLALLGPRLDRERDSALLAQIAAVERATWLKGQALVRRLRPALGALVDAGIAPVLLKGPAVAHHAGTTLRTRPMDDLDVLVARDEVAGAVGVLARAGFVGDNGPLLHRAPELVLPHVHGEDLADAHGAAFDLHWRVLHGPGHPDGGAPFLAAAVPTTWQDLDVRVTSREDTLVHAVAHSVAHHGSLRWATDAALLIRTGAVDWAWVVARAGQFGVGPAVAGALTVLQRLDAVDVAPAVVRELGRQRPPRAVRALGRAARRPGPAVEARDVLWGLSRSVPPGAPVGRREVAHVRRRLAAALSGPASREAVAIALGELVELNVRPDGRPPPWPMAGWGYPEGDGTWTTDGRARLLLELDAAHDGPLQVELLVSAMVGPRRPRLDVEVHDADERIATWSFAGSVPRREPRTLWLDARPGRRDVDLRLTVLDPRTADEAGVNGEQRRFGMALHCLRILPGAEPGPT